MLTRLVEFVSPVSGAVQNHKCPFTEPKAICQPPRITMSSLCYVQESVGDREVILACLITCGSRFKSTLI